SSGAQSAISTSATKAQRPITAPRLRLKCRQKSRSTSRVAERAERSIVAVTLSVMPVLADPSMVPDARVDEAVEKVDDQVDDHDHARDQQQPALHSRIVAAEDGIDHPLADSGPGEDRLGQDG